MDQPTEKQNLIWRVLLLFILVFGVGLILLGNDYFHDDTIAAIGGTSCLGLYLLARTIPEISARLASRRRKMDGEPARILDATFRMNALLDGLGPDYYFIKEIASPNGMASYVVINRWRGAFLLVVEVVEGEVKVKDGKVWVNNKPARVDFPSRALQYAQSFKDRLIKLIGTRPWITPVVVFTHANVMADQPVNGVLLVAISYLPAALQKVGHAVSSNSEVWDMRMKIAQSFTPVD